MKVKGLSDIEVLFPDIIFFTDDFQLHQEAVNLKISLTECVK